MVVLRNTETYRPPFREPVFTKDEMDKIDQLIGYAMLYSDVCSSLVEKRDPSLRMQFGLAESTWRLLASINANTLDDFCDQLCEWQLTTN